MSWRLDQKHPPQLSGSDIHAHFTPHEAVVWLDGINGKNENGSQAPYMASHAWMPPHLREQFTYRQMRADEVYRLFHLDDPGVR